VGLFDVIAGRRRLKEPAPDRLFAVTTAAVTLESAHGVSGAGSAAIVFQALATSDFEAALSDTEQVVRGTGADSGIAVRTVDDDYGYRWMVLGGGSVEDLAVGINAVSSSIEAAGHGERLLCAVFAFRDAASQRVYFIYNYKRGKWYPFVPASDAHSRQTEAELRLRAQLAGELPIEPELERWFPLWGAPI
jgi:hypothetical protein